MYSADGRMIDEHSAEEDLEASRCRLIEVLSWHLPRSSEENTKNLGTAGGPDDISSRADVTYQSTA
jgi:hypothetical protein